MATPKTLSVARYRLSVVPEVALPRTPFGFPGSVAEFLHETLEETRQEVTGTVLLDERNTAIGYHLAYIARVEPRGLLVPALLSNAAGMVAFHKRGETRPRGEDWAFTQHLREAGEIVGVTVLDHIILGEKPAYFSLRRSYAW